jgi:hypothetical protein
MQHERGFAAVVLDCRVQERTFYAAALNAGITLALG